MNVQKTPPYNPTFQYSSILKKAFKRGDIKLTKDITGHPLTKKTATLDHTIPKSKGGKSCLSNYNLMNGIVNKLRGSESLKKYVDLESFVEYVIVMLETDTKGFNGIEYLKKWLPNFLKEIRRTDNV